MKTSTTFGLIAAASLIAFFAGRISVSPLDPAEAGQGGGSESRPERELSAEQQRLASRPEREQSAREALERGDNLSMEQCLLLTSEERLRMVRKGALIFDDMKQAAYLAGVIKSLDREELAQARSMIGRAQARGNGCAQAVWDSIWKQSGRLDPEETIASFNRGKTRSDARHVMEGWFETDASAALAWARQPQESYHGTAAAAYAFTCDANGDPERLIESLATLDPDHPVLAHCLQDYFDLSDASSTSEGTAEIYDGIPAAMQEQAWSVAMRRLSYTDFQEAVDWFAEHVDDPGCDYRQTRQLFAELSKEDPAGATTWAATLPPNPEDEYHPVEQTYSSWRQADPEAAGTWLETIGDSTPWAARLRGGKKR
ncbi:hypothetical protein [Haloferula sp.]|uniref:hypothetical protein n=1 Tax=Haloferula sp. TaxID=2497595 RepID=UPI00329F2601